jgi:hypothetical protein
MSIISLWRAFHGCFLPSFGSFGYGVSEEKIKILCSFHLDPLTNMDAIGNVVSV